MATDGRPHAELTHMREEARHMRTVLQPQRMLDQVLFENSPYCFLHHIINDGSHNLRERFWTKRKPPEGDSLQAAAY